MIVDLPATSTAAVSKRLLQLRNEVGALALGRVLTLIVVVNDEAADDAVEVATEASRQHPCRIIVVVSGTRRGSNRIDGQIRIGGDAGASEVVILRLFGQLAAQGQSVVTPLLLADSPSLPGGRVRRRPICATTRSPRWRLDGSPMRLRPPGHGPCSTASRRPTSLETPIWPGPG